MFCRHCGKEVPSDTSVNFCPSCGRLLGGNISSGTQKQAFVRLARFNTPSDIVFQSCISSLSDLGITTNRIDKVTKHIETAAATKSPLGNYSPDFFLEVIEESESVSVIKVTILSQEAGLASDAFNRLISTVESKLNQKPTTIEEGMVSDINTPGGEPNRDYPVNRMKPSKMDRKGSIVLGIIVGIWTAFFVFIVIDYNIRLASIAENAFGLGVLVLARTAPSIEISTIIALLFMVMTILLLVRPRKSPSIALLVLSVINMLLTF